MKQISSVSHHLVERILEAPYFFKHTLMCEESTPMGLLYHMSGLVFVAWEREGFRDGFTYRHPSGLFSAIASPGRLLITLQGHPKQGVISYI